MTVIFENQDGDPVGAGDDGMADWIAKAEADGWEGEHVFDASVEDPPHPFWDAKNGCCYPEPDDNEE